MPTAMFTGRYLNGAGPAPCEYDAYWKVNPDGTVAWRAEVRAPDRGEVIQEPFGLLLIAPHIDLVDAVKKAVEGAIEKSGCCAAD